MDGVLLPDFEEFISLLNKYKVQYLIVGGYALAYHGLPRYTNALDIWMDASEPNGQKMQEVCLEYGICPPIDKYDLLRKDSVCQIGCPPLSISLFNSLDGLSFQPAFLARQTTLVGLTNAYFISLVDLIKNKRAANSLQDLADIDMLKEL